MNDSLKCRVWDIEDKVYHGFAWYVNNCQTIFNELEYNLNPRYIVEQCTGLRDKNGVLIFEGDRVSDTTVDLSFVYCYGDIEHTVISKFTGENVKVKLTCFYQVYDGVEEDKVLPMEKVISENEYLIIGNIHEVNQ